MQATINAPEDQDICEDSGPSRITALLVMGEHPAALLKALAACHIDLLVAYDCKEARTMIETQPSVQILLTSRTLRDQGWVGTMELMAQIPDHVELIIYSGLNDPKRLMNALELGAYDVLFPPYEANEVQTVIAAAAAKSQRRSHHDATLKKLRSFLSTPDESASTWQHEACTSLLSRLNG